MRVLAVQNTPRGGPGRVGDWLEEVGLTVDVVHAYEGEAVPHGLTHSALVVLGGGFMPDDDARAPWLAATRGLVAAALAERTPVLGICLGGQMLAHVAGGKVAAGHGVPEMGSTALSMRAEAAADPLFHSLPKRVTAIERHVDAVTSLPPGAVWLARSDRCPYQAFRVGERAWGVQFHPETAPERLLTWDAARLAEHGHDRQALYRGAEEDARTATPVWREVIRRFAALVREEPETGRAGR
ncbi:type 1 glutamine amidotransferase [Streptomyces reniochalinae]|uniref:Type 1 glutamine amidotransferase n=1 Tax=Streptomyces reniochalinae TaxID=2250578 RepID=A0A367EW61_9ACTN|nr:type 1 glutamine amidotransferase [Streptomyces reniochalinae]RCG22241.1 type 1 glutamine amidotransferase [Streptomyces reniochalinae]